MMVPFLILCKSDRSYIRGPAAQLKESLMQKQVQPRRQRRRKRRSWVRAVVILIFVAAAVTGLVKCLIHPPAVSSPDGSADSAAASSSEDDGPTRLSRKDQFYTILLSGVDDDNGGSDTNILVAFDAAGGSVHCVSIPRDTGAYINGSPHKINLASKTSTAKLAETVSHLLGIPVDFTIEVDLQGFVDLVNAIGGVDFEVPINMNYDDPTQNLHIHFNAGMQHLYGEDAIKVVRFRHNNDGSGYGTEDIGRISTQQAFLKAVAQQTLTLSNADKIPEFAKIFQQYVTTDLEVGELAWFGTQALSIGTENITFSTLPGAWSDARALYLLDAEEVLTLVNESLNPYILDRVAEDLQIP